MTLKEINIIYHEVFGKFLHVNLKLVEGNNFTKDFLEEFNNRWKSKEVSIAHLNGTSLDNNRWDFGDDLTIYMNSIPKFDQMEGDFVSTPLVFASFEAKVMNCSMHTLYKLAQFIPADRRKDYLDYVTFMSSEWSVQ